MKCGGNAFRGPASGSQGKQCGPIECTRSLKFEYPVKAPRDHKGLGVLHPDPTAYALRPFLLLSGMSQCPLASQAGSSKFCHLQWRSLHDSQTVTNIIMASVVTKVILNKLGVPLGQDLEERQQRLGWPEWSRLGRSLGLTGVQGPGIHGDNTCPQSA